MYIHVINCKSWCSSKISKRRKAGSLHAYLEFSFKKLLGIHMKIITFDFLNLSLNQNLALNSFHSLFPKALILCPLISEYLLNYVYISLTFIVYMRVF